MTHQPHAAVSPSASFAVFWRIKSVPLHGWWRVKASGFPAGWVPVRR